MAEAPAKIWFGKPDGSFSLAPAAWQGRATIFGYVMLLIFTVVTYSQLFITIFVVLLYTAIFFGIVAMRSSMKEELARRASEISEK